jgi:opacity protein-like surface antigen
MKNLSTILLITMLWGAAGSSAMAQEFAYGAVDVGQSKASDVCTGPGCTDTAAVLRIAGGYQFVPMLGAEVSYGYYGRQSLGGSSGDWKASGFQASGIGTFPLGKGFSLTGKLGIAATRLERTASNQSATSTNLAFGIGARYDFNRDVGVRAQYENLGDVGDASTGKTNISLITAGIIVRF